MSDKNENPLKLTGSMDKLLKMAMEPEKKESKPIKKKPKKGK